MTHPRSLLTHPGTESRSARLPSDNRTREMLFQGQDLPFPKAGISPQWKRVARYVRMSPGMA